MGASTDFPWQRFRAAQEYLYALKPWWRRFGNKIKWVAIETPPPPGFTHAATSFVGTNLNVYVDRNFVIQSPLHIISGRIEHDLQMVVRKVHSRLPNTNPDQSVQRNMAFELEINSAMMEELRANGLDTPIKGMQLSRLLKNSSLFTPKDMEKWSVTSWPKLGESAILPETIGLPPELSAEEYFRILDQQDREDQLDQLYDSGEDVVADSESNDPGTESKQQDEPAPQESGEQDQTQPDQEENQQGQNASNEDGSGASSQSDSPNDPDGFNQSSESGNNQNSDSQQEPQEDDSPDSADGQSGQSGGDGDQLNAMQMISAMMDADPLLDWDGRDQSYLNNDQGADQEVNEYEMNQALSEVAEDIMGDSGSLGFGLEPGNSIVKWTQTNLIKKSENWQNRLSACMTRNLSSAKIDGATDFSYSVPNPNQHMDAPILMGMHDYAPTLYIVLDVSGSMMNVMGQALSTLRDIVRSMSMRYEVDTTWITIDSKVRDVGRSINIDQKTVRRIVNEQGFGGTEIKYLLMDVVEGKFRWKGRLHRKPDMLLVITDCGFLWPWVYKKPKTSTRVIVASTRPHDLVTNTKGRVDFPNWIGPKNRNFVHIMADRGI